MIFSENRFRFSGSCSGSANGAVSRAGRAKYRNQAGRVNPNRGFTADFRPFPREGAMKLDGLPIGAVDWRQVAPVAHAGETGTATARTREVGGVQLRVVQYGAGYRADHWCGKGHIVHVLAGDLVIEHDDGRRFALAAGMTWHASDETGPPHRVLCETGATVFIVD